jgi:thymidylate synthase (FAD)
MDYKFEKARKEVAEEALDEITAAYERAFQAYNNMLDLGVAREVARFVLPQGALTSFYATGSLRNWLNFLVLRTSEAALLEIRRPAFEVESIIKELWPECYNCWVLCDRPQI